MHTLWNGSLGLYLDEINTMCTNSVVCGMFGGSTKSGATFNEDGFFILETEKWRFVTLFDAHATFDSVTVLTNALSQNEERLRDICNQNIDEAIEPLQAFILTVLKETSTDGVRGETAVLFCFEKAGFLWWLSVGDNSLYLLHKEFNELGQYRLNQRVFYQWFGEQNAMKLSPACYASGTIQLRMGQSTIVMLTDGVLEVSGRPYENSAYLASKFAEGSLEEGIIHVLEEVQSLDGRDSATIIAFHTSCPRDGLRPTRL